MSYKAWLQSIKFGIMRRYKVNNISSDDTGLRIDFVNNFHYLIDESVLKLLWEKDGFNYLCENIEKEYLEQIMNI